MQQCVAHLFTVSNARWHATTFFFSRSFFAQSLPIPFVEIRDDADAAVDFEPAGDDDDDDDIEDDDEEAGGNDEDDEDDDDDEDGPDAKKQRTE